MFDNYEEYYNEPTEVDVVIAEAKEKLNSLLTESVKEVMENASNAQKKLDELESKINDKKWKLKNISEKLSEMEKKLEQSETRDVPKKYIERFVRDATGNFAPGDSVWYLQLKYMKEDCPDCHGSKKVLASVSGKEIQVDCPTCKGYGFLSKSHYEVIEKTIESIHLKLCFNEERVSYWNKECVYLVGKDSHVDAKYIFNTKEEAEKRLKELEK